MYRYAGALVVVGFVALSAFTPVGVSFVYSDSMEPALATGDGFLVVPADDAESGDVITFWSEPREEYVTHRVVEETDAGYVTQGDNNRITDQSTGHPHVQSEDVAGTVLTVREEPVTIPGVGDAVLFASRYVTVLVAGAALALALAAGTSTTPSRSVLRARTLFRALLVTSVALSVVWILLAGSAVSFPVSQTENGATPETVIFDEETVDVSFTASQTPYTHRSAASSDVRIVDSSPTDDGVELTLALDDPEVDTATVRFYEYPAVLPAPVIRAVHGVHPVVAAAVTAGVAHLPVIVLYLATFDGREPIRGARWRRPLRGP